MCCQLGDVTGTGGSTSRWLTPMAENSTGAVGRGLRSSPWLLGLLDSLVAQWQERMSQENKAERASQFCDLALAIMSMISSLLYW